VRDAAPETAQEAAPQTAGDTAGPPPVDLARADQRLEKHSVTLFQHRTSLSLEPPFWAALRRLAAARGQSLNALIAEIDAARSGNLSSAVRVWVLQEIAAGR
jgi:predicted DNA-binding ribbon-helix-helix protein